MVMCDRDETGTTDSTINRGDPDGTLQNSYKTTARACTDGRKGSDENPS